MHPWEGPRPRATAPASCATCAPSAPSRGEERSRRESGVVPHDPRCPHCGFARPAPDRRRVDDALARAHDARAATLRPFRERRLTLDGAPIPALTMPEDGSYRVRRWSVTVDPSREMDVAMLRSLREIAKSEGFEVVATVPPAKAQKLREVLTDEELETVRLEGYDAESPWTEDDREYATDGSVRVPARWLGPESSVTASIERAQVEGRAARGVPQDALGLQGVVGQSDIQRDAAVAAVADGRPLRENLSYAEGGNVLRGTDAKGAPYAIVGRDTVALTQQRLAEDLGRTIEEEEAVAAIGHDLGLRPEQVHLVEQPGSLHVDMAMLPLRDGRIIVNDSRAAATLQAQWLREDAGGHSSLVERQIEELHRTAALRAGLEDRAASDLEAAGFRVLRMPAVFPSTAPGKPPMNFLNTESGVGSDGRSFLVMLGGDRRAQHYVAEFLTNEVPSGVDRLYFLPERVSDNLRADGGLNCRVKGEGDPILGADARARSDPFLRAIDVIDLECTACHQARSAPPRRSQRRTAPMNLP